MMRWSSALGEFDLELGEHGISSLVEPTGDPSDAEPVPSELAKALDAHLRGESSSLQLDLQGVTPLSQHVLAKLLEIPRGEVRSYSWVAREVGNPKAVRAVASAVARNPIPVLIPCHRVLPTNGAVGEYSLGGPKEKRRILEFESVDLDRIEGLGRRGARYVHAEDGSFHVLSCRLAGSDTALPLSSIDDAHAKNLTPCRSCKP
jgi:O-6-methylguanine DNA methyltransferase